MINSYLNIRPRSETSALNQHCGLINLEVYGEEFKEDISVFDNYIIYL